MTAFVLPLVCGFERDLTSLTFALLSVRGRSGSGGISGTYESPPNVALPFAEANKLVAPELR